MWTVGTSFPAASNAMRQPGRILRGLFTSSCSVDRTPVDSVHHVQSVCFNPASFGFSPPPSPLPNLLFQAAGTRPALRLARVLPQPRLWVALASNDAAVGMEEVRVGERCKPGWRGRLCFFAG